MRRDRGILMHLSDILDKRVNPSDRGGSRCENLDPRSLSAYGSVVAGNQNAVGGSDVE
jgi:hypothetical protein